MSTIRFRCFHCGRTHTVKVEAAGRRGRCACGKLMLVPSPAPGAAPEGDLPTAAPVLEDASPRAGAPAPAASSVSAPPQSARVMESSSPESPPAASGSSRPSRAAARRGGCPESPELPEALGGPAAREPLDEGAPAVLCAAGILLGLIVLGAWAAVRFPRLCENLLGAVLVERVDFLSLPGSFWSTALLVLSVVLIGGGIARLRRR